MYIEYGLKIEWKCMKLQTYKTKSQKEELRGTGKRSFRLVQTLGCPIHEGRKKKSTT
jgi:hypothetical protein